MPSIQQKPRFRADRGATSPKKQLQKISPSSQQRGPASLAQGRNRIVHGRSEWKILKSICWRQNFSLSACLLINFTRNLLVGVQISRPSAAWKTGEMARLPFNLDPSCSFEIKPAKPQICAASQPQSFLSIRVHLKINFLESSVFQSYARDQNEN